MAFTKIATDLVSQTRLLVIAGITGIVLLSWAYLTVEANRMGSVDITVIAELHARDTMGLSMLFTMWVIMMLAMMLPSALPMILLHAAVLKKYKEKSPSQNWTIPILVAGYLSVWVLFSLIATALQALLENLALLSPMMVSTSPQFGGLILIMAGIYQLTPLKNACLAHCKSPISYITENWLPGLSGAYRMGARHGLYCVGCCWILMALLFVGGVMNLLWIALISLFILLEKTAPLGSKIGRVFSGFCLMALGFGFWVS